MYEIYYNQLNFDRVIQENVVDVFGDILLTKGIILVII